MHLTKRKGKRKMTIEEYIRKNKNRCIYCVESASCSMDPEDKNKACDRMEPETLKDHFDLTAIETEQINPNRFCSSEAAWNRRRRRIQKKIYETKARLGLTGISITEDPGLSPLLNELIEEISHPGIQYLTVPMSEIFCRWKGYETEESYSLYYKDFPSEIDDLTFLFHVLFASAGYEVELEGEMAPFLRIELPKPKRTYYFDL